MYRVVLVFLLLFVASLNVVRAQHHDATASLSNGAVDLGKIEFPNSGPADAQ